MFQFKPAKVAPVTPVTKFEMIKMSAVFGKCTGDVHLSRQSRLAQWCIRSTMQRRHMGATVLPARIRQQIHQYIPCYFVYCIMLVPV